MPEPITLAEARTAARLDPDDHSLDWYIDGAIVAARKAAEHITQRVFVAQTITVPLTDWPADDEPLRVPNPTACAITYWDGAAWATLSSGAYSFEPYQNGTILWPVTQWPTLGKKTGDRVRIAVTAEPEGDVPEAVKLYCMAMVAAWVADPEAQQGKPLMANPLFERLLDPVRVWG